MGIKMPNELYNLYNGQYQIGYKDTHFWACQFGDWSNNRQSRDITIRLSNLELNSAVAGSNNEERLVNCIITTHISWSTAVKFATDHNCPDINWSVSFTRDDPVFVNMMSAVTSQAIVNFIHQTLREIIMSTHEFMTVSYQEYINIIWAGGSQKIPDFNAYYIGSRQVSCKQTRGLSRENVITAGARKLVQFCNKL